MPAVQSAPEITNTSAGVQGGVQITTTICRTCGARVDGLNNRYACGLCGWANHWAEGSAPLPTLQDDTR